MKERHNIFWLIQVSYQLTKHAGIWNLSCSHFYQDDDYCDYPWEWFLSNLTTQLITFSIMFYIQYTAPPSPSLWKQAYLDTTATFHGLFSCYLCSHIFFLVIVYTVLIWRCFIYLLLRRSLVLFLFMLSVSHIQLLFAVSRKRSSHCSLPSP